MSAPDAIVVGSGPNGLAAAITLAQAGRTVTVLEADRTIGGGCRSAELTLPGFVHDVCSAVHPFAAASPLFRTLPLERYGLEWVQPPVSLAHPLDDGDAALIVRSLDDTARGLGRDGRAYRRLLGPMSAAVPLLEKAISEGKWLAPALRVGLSGLSALRDSEALARGTFGEERTRALLGGVAAHSMLPLDMRPTAGVAMVLSALAHGPGWVFPRRGAQALTDALVAHLRSLGGEVVTGERVRSIDDLPPARAVLCDLSPGPLLAIAGHRFPARFRRALERFRGGMGVFKVDWALDGPIPWRNPDCAGAGTLHLGGTLAEVAASERDAWEGRHPERPFVLLAQPTPFDTSRAPAGKHVAWTYCHVPRGSTVDMTDALERQIERFAPGFRERVLARAVMRTDDFERHDANFVGGDISMGAMTLSQLVTRPTWRMWSTPLRGLYLCSASTPPGVGVHGMCGYFAAQRALRQVLRE
jgi:phytoene dehydrogenase-like protein